MLPDLFSPTQIDYANDIAAVIIHGFTCFFKNIVVSNNFKTGMLLVNSSSTMSGSRNLFSYNSGIDSGGIRLYQSQLTFAWDTTLQFTNNSAIKGGAMYIHKECIFDIVENVNEKEINGITIAFQNKTAPIAPNI